MASLGPGVGLPQVYLRSGIVLNTKEMAKGSRSVKTLTINKSRDIIVDKLLRRCEEGAHGKCTGWAVLKKEISPIDANYFLKCTCSCHRKKAKPQTKKKLKKSVAKRVKRKAKKKAKRRQKLAKRSKKKTKRTRR